MAVSVFSSKGVVDTGEWYRVDAPEVSYRYSIATLATRDLVEVRAYAQDGQSTPIVNIIFTDSAWNNLTSHNTVDQDTGSGLGYSDLIVRVPIGAAGIKLGTLSAASFVFIRPFQATPFPPLTPMKYSFTQGVGIANTANVAVLGGGGAGGGYTATSGPRGGGGSGYLVHGTVAPGVYTAFIGAGAIGAANSGATGGTTIFSNISATGGIGGTGSAGGAGGSGGGGPGSQTAGVPGPAGGFNGNNGISGGTGSAVTANLFTPANAATPVNGAGVGGGVYGGGSGGGGDSASGNAANASGGGGGGAGYRSGSGTQTLSGGSGFAGAVWVLES